MKLYVLTKGKPRPIGYVSPGGYEKTAKGWRKTSQPLQGAATAKPKVPIAISTSTAEEPSITKYAWMSIPEMEKVAKEKFEVYFGNIKDTNKKHFNSLMYQMDMMSYLGFKNKKYLVLYVEDGYKGAAKLSTGKNDITLAYYSPPSQSITVGTRYKNSFVHEYFHHIYHTAPYKTRIEMAEEMRAMPSFSRFQQIDKRLGKSYYAQATEMFARLGNQLIHYTLKEQNVKSDVRLTRAPMTGYIDFRPQEAKKLREAFKDYFEQLRKSLAAILVKARLHYRTEFQGLPISIENRKGSVRKWYDPMKKESGETKMKYPYGYIRLTEGSDGDHVDCYIGPHSDCEKVFVVHQNNPTTGEYDEDKVMLGFRTRKEAKRAYLDHYNDARFFGSMDQFNIDTFKEKVKKKKGKVGRS